MESKYSSKNKAIVVDLDGTIADNSHRTHYVEGHKKNWTDFFESIKHDSPIKENILLVLEYYQKDYEIIFLTGRFEKYQKLTTSWLDKYISIDSYHLIQRKNHDFRSAETMKETALFTLNEKFHIELIIDDDDKILALGKRMGINSIDAKKKTKK